MLNVTTAAVSKIRELIAEEGNPSVKLRLFVQGGGCSGFQYGFVFETEKTEDDLEFNFEDVGILVDSMSYQYVENVSVDYKDDLTGAGFAIENPRAVTTCGCGSSFSV